MSIFLSYATKEDLAEYIGTGVDSLPKNVDILLNRASEIITIAMRNNYNPENEEHKILAKMATCAQAQNWINRKLDGVTSYGISSYSLEGLSITYADVDGFGNKISKTSAGYLNKAGLMYKGMR